MVTLNGLCIFIASEQCELSIFVSCWFAKNSHRHQPNGTEMESQDKHGPQINEIQNKIWNVFCFLWYSQWLTNLRAFCLLQQNMKQIFDKGQLIQYKQTFNSSWEILFVFCLIWNVSIVFLEERWGFNRPWRLWSLDGHNHLTVLLSHELMQRRTQKMIIQQR